MSEDDRPCRCAELEGLVLRMADYIRSQTDIIGSFSDLAESTRQVHELVAGQVESWTAILDTNTELAASAQQMTDHYQAEADKIRDRRLADLAADLSGDPRSGNDPAPTET